jgi:acyl-CoA dehydrogenase
VTIVDALAALRERGPDESVESALLGEWLLERAGLDGEAGTVTVAPRTSLDGVVLREGRVSGVVHRVPWARNAARIAVVVDGRAAVLDRAAVTVEPHANLAGEPRDTVAFDGAAALSAPGVDAGELFVRGALVRIALMAGALDRLYEITVSYASKRRQFGRSIGSFQAVQQHLVTVAQQAALTGVAAATTARRPSGFEVAAGKLLANRAALVAGRAAHQVLGARGTTREHPLAELTTRLWAWRSEYGDEHHWSGRLGAAVARAGADSLYPAITGGSTVLSLESSCATS